MANEASYVFDYTIKPTIDTSNLGTFAKELQDVLKDAELNLNVDDATKKLKEMYEQTKATRDEMSKGFKYNDKDLRSVILQLTQIKQLSELLYGVDNTDSFSIKINKQEIKNIDDLTAKIQELNTAVAEIGQGPSVSSNNNFGKPIQDRISEIVAMVKKTTNSALKDVAKGNDISKIVSTAINYQIMNQGYQKGETRDINLEGFVKIDKKIQDILTENNVDMKAFTEEWKKQIGAVDGSYESLQKRISLVGALMRSNIGKGLADNTGEFINVLNAESQKFDMTAKIKELYGEFERLQKTGKSVGQLAVDIQKLAYELQRIDGTALKQIFNDKQLQSIDAEVRGSQIYKSLTQGNSSVWKYYQKSVQAFDSSKMMNIDKEGLQYEYEDLTYLISQFAELKQLIPKNEFDQLLKSNDIDVSKIQEYFSALRNAIKNAKVEIDDLTKSSDEFQQNIGKIFGMKHINTEWLTNIGTGTGNGTGYGTGNGTGYGTGDGTGDGIDSQELESIKKLIEDFKVLKEQIGTGINLFNADNLENAKLRISELKQIKDEMGDGIKVIGQEDEKEKKPINITDPQALETLQSIIISLEKLIVELNNTQFIQNTGELTTNVEKLKTVVDAITELSTNENMAGLRDLNATLYIEDNTIKNLRSFNTFLKNLCSSLENLDVSKLDKITYLDFSNIAQGIGKSINIKIDNSSIETALTDITALLKEANLKVNITPEVTPEAKSNIDNVIEEAPQAKTEVVALETEIKKLSEEIFSGQESMKSGSKLSEIITIYDELKIKLQELSEKFIEYKQLTGNDFVDTTYTAITPESLPKLQNELKSVDDFKRLHDEIKIILQDFKELQSQRSQLDGKDYSGKIEIYDKQLDVLAQLVDKIEELKKVTKEYDNIQLKGSLTEISRGKATSFSLGSDSDMKALSSLLITKQNTAKVNKAEQDEATNTITQLLNEFKNLQNEYKNTLDLSISQHKGKGNLHTTLQNLSAKAESIRTGYEKAKKSQQYDEKTLNEIYALEKEIDGIDALIEESVGNKTKEIWNTFRKDKGAKVVERKTTTKTTSTETKTTPEVTTAPIQEESKVIEENTEKIKQDTAAVKENTNAKKEAAQVNAEAQKTTPVQDNTVALKSQMQQYNNQLKNVKQSVSELQTAINEIITKEPVKIPALSPTPEAITSLKAQIEEGLKGQVIALTDINYAGKNGAGVTGSGTQTGEATGNEITAFTQIQQAVEAVTAAINEKNKAIETESSTLSAESLKEIEYLGNIQSAFETLSAEINKQIELKLTVTGIEEAKGQISAVKAEIQNNSDMNFAMSDISANANTDNSNVELLIQSVKNIETLLNNNESFRVNGNPHYITDEQGNVKTFYRGLMNCMGAGLTSSSYHNNAVFYTDSVEVAQGYAEGGKIEAVNIATLNPLEIDGKGAPYNEIEYLGNYSDEASNKIHQVKDDLINLNDELKSILNSNISFNNNQVTNILGKYKNMFNLSDVQYRTYIEDSLNSLLKDLNTSGQSDKNITSLIDNINNIIVKYNELNSLYDKISNDSSNVYGFHTTDEFVKLAQNNGYDSVIFKNIMDPDLNNVVVPFHQAQIKFIETMSTATLTCEEWEKDLNITDEKFRQILNEIPARVQEIINNVNNGSISAEDSFWAIRDQLIHYQNPLNWNNDNDLSQHYFKFIDQINDFDSLHLQDGIQPLIDMYHKYRQTILETINGINTNQSISFNNTNTDLQNLPVNVIPAENTVANLKGEIETGLQNVKISSFMPDNVDKLKEEITKQVGQITIDFEAPQDKTIEKNTKKIKEIQEAFENVTIAVTNYKSALDGDNPLHKALEEDLKLLKDMEAACKNISASIGVITSGVNSVQSAIRESTTSSGTLNTSTRRANALPDISGYTDKQDVIAKYREIETLTNKINSNEQSATEAERQQLQQAKKELTEMLAIYSRVGDNANKIFGIDINKLGSDLQIVQNKMTLAQDSSLNETISSLGSQIEEIKKANVGSMNAEELRQFEDTIKRVRSELDQLKNSQQSLSRDTNLDVSISKINAKFNDLINKLNQQKTLNSRFMRDPAMVAQYNSLMNSLQNMSRNAENFHQLDEQVKAFKNTVTSRGLTGRSLGDELAYIAQKIGVKALLGNQIYRVISYFRKMVSTVKELDTALTEVKRVSEETEATYRKFMQNAKKDAVDLGSTVTSLVSSTGEFARLGYSVQEASELAKNAVMYSNVGWLDVSTATSDMVSTMKAFNLTASDSIKIVDTFDILGNKFSLTAADVGQGLKESASALATANNSFEQSAAMITAITEITQDASSAGKKVA